MDNIEILYRPAYPLGEWVANDPRLQGALDLHEILADIWSFYFGAIGPDEGFDVDLLPAPWELLRMLREMADQIEDLTEPPMETL
jgi:hypothetical protein